MKVMLLRLAVVMSANIALAWLLTILGAFLAPFGLMVQADALVLLFPALYLPLGHGLGATVLTFLLWDAARPYPFGLGLGIALLAWTLLRPGFQRTDPRNPWPLILRAAAAQLIIAFLHTVAASHGRLTDPAYWLAGTWPLLLSLLLVALLANPMIQAQRLLLIRLSPSADK